MSIVSTVLPDVGEGVGEAELVEWSVKIGDVVLEDEVVAAVMTDKAAVEIPSSATGTVVWLAGEIGDVIAVGAELVRIETEEDRVKTPTDNTSTNCWPQNSDSFAENTVETESTQEISKEQDPLSFQINQELNKTVMVSPVVGHLSAVLINSSKSLQKQKLREDKQQLEIELKKQEIEIARAKTAQELAIAERIHSSKEVEIEEYFEVEGEGSLGVNSAQENKSLGAAGKGSKVRKRVIRFTEKKEV